MAAARYLVSISFLGLTIFSGLSSARAFEAGEVDGHPVSIDLTETAIINYRFDNRDNTGINDYYGEWHNRFNAQLSWWHLIFGLRVDSSNFFATPQPAELAQDDLEVRPPPGPYEIPETDAEFRARATDSYGTDLSNRYLNTIYPSKIYLSYAVPGFEATVGDVYAQFGRGLILSVRKIDELAVDTTIRGAKLSYSEQLGPDGRVGITLLGGYANPLRVDESSGRVLWAPSQWYFLGMPTPQQTHYIDDPVPSFVPDRILGASLEGGPSWLRLGTHAVMLDRPSSCYLNDASELCTPYQNTFEKGSSQIRNVSQSLSVPDIAGHGSFYVEVATQQQRSDHPAPGTYDDTYYQPRLPEEDVNGYAVYTSFSANEDPFVFTFEGKHYREFFPLTANIKMAPRQGAVPEFQQLQYSAPPTTLPVWVDTEVNSFNTCVTGGRGRLDARVNEDLLLYGWLGRYYTWGERGTPECDSDLETSRNDVWDSALGIELLLERKRSHVFAWIGARDDQMAAREDVEASPSSTFYREGYIRYDLVKHITSSISVQVAGNARHREDTTKPLPWWEGENYTALQWSRLTMAFGYEYQTSEGLPTNYYNGQIKWRINADTNVRLFAGQQRGALRCISGVCRQFPPFEGAKAEVVLRF